MVSIGPAEMLGFLFERWLAASAYVGGVAAHPCVKCLHCAYTNFLTPPIAAKVKRANLSKGASLLVPGAGLEPARPFQVEGF